MLRYGEAGEPFEGGNGRSGSLHLRKVPKHFSEYVLTGSRHHLVSVLYLRSCPPYGLFRFILKSFLSTIPAFIPLPTLVITSQPCSLTSLKYALYTAVLSRSHFSLFKWYLNSLGLYGTKWNMKKLSFQGFLIFQVAYHNYVPQLSRSSLTVSSYLYVWFVWDASLMRPVLGISRNHLCEQQAG